MGTRETFHSAEYAIAIPPYELHVHEGLTTSLIKRGDKQRCLLIYCYHGHASQHLAEFFADFGFKDVYSLEGGYTAWQNKLSSFPIS